MPLFSGSFFPSIASLFRGDLDRAQQAMQRGVGQVTRAAQPNSQQVLAPPPTPMVRPGLTGGYGGIQSIFNQRFGSAAAGMYRPGLLSPGFTGLGPGMVPGAVVRPGWANPTVTSPETQKIEAQQAAAKAKAAAGGQAGAFGQGATGADAATDKWRDLIDQSAAANGIDGDVIQAIMMIESQGNAGARSGAGAMGLMQVMPNWFEDGEDGMDPKTNVMKGGKILADNYNRYKNWDSAVAAYLGAVDANGNPTTATDMYGTSGIKYAQMFNANLQAIKAKRQQQPAKGGGGGSMASVTPGAAGTIMQEFGPTDYATAHPSTYAYGNAYGLAGSQHPGIDWAVPMGSQVATPLGGTVFVVGNDHGSGYYYTNTMSNSDRDHSGEFAVQLDNGDILILGHLSAINATVGQRVNAGQAIGLSGGSDGAHVHVEYRKRNPNGGYTIIDPRTVLR